MKRNWKNFLIGVALVAFFVLLAGFNATKPRILVLNSKPPDSVWSRKFREGAMERLQRNRRPLAVEWAYLDFDPAGGRLPKAVEEAGVQRAVRRFDPDVLIAVDDEANAMVARGLAGRERPRIIYVSIDREPGFYGYGGARNVSGIADRLPLPAFKDLAGVVGRGRPLRIAAIGVDSETGQAELAQLLSYDWAPHALASSATVGTVEAWQEFVRGAGADILLVLDGGDLPRSPTDPTIVPAAELVRWTEAESKALPVGTNVSFVEAGGGLSFAPPPDDCGEKAIELALDWLDARDTPGAPPPIVSGHFEVAVRQATLAARGVVLPPIYLEAARENGTLYP
jgi:hypothetical protein